MVTISYAIMHVCPSPRCEWVDQIQAKIPTSVVVYDHHTSLWDTARRSWLLAQSDVGATHAMVLQDDMLPCPGFAAALKAIVSQRPSHAISVFAPPFRPKPGSVRHWINDVWTGDGKPGFRDTIGPATWGGSVVLPIGLVKDFVDAADGYDDIGAEVDDQRMDRWLAKSGQPFAHHYPQMLDHVGWDSSLIGHPAEEWRRGVRSVFPLEHVEWRRGPCL